MIHPHPFTTAADAVDAVIHAELRDQIVIVTPPAARITAHGWSPWASASFTGARHWFDLRGEADPAAWAVQALGDHIWTISGAIVADTCLSRDTLDAGIWRIELLVVHD